MTVFNTTIKSTAVGAAMLLIAGIAAAQTLSDNGTTRDLGQDTFYSAYGSAPGGAGFVGAKSLTYTPVSGASSTFWAYCIDPRTNAGFPSTSYTSTSLSNFLNGTTTSAYAAQVGSNTNYSGLNLGGSNSTEAAAKQSAVYNNLVNLYSHAYLDAIGTANPGTTQSSSSAKAAAFGMAVWEIIMQDGGTLSRTTGNMRSNGGDNTSGNPGSDSVEAWTNAYLNALNTNSWTGMNGTTLDLSASTNFTYTVWYDVPSPGKQNFLQVALAGNGNSVPVPGTLALVGLALVGAARLSRRRLINA